MLRPLLTLGCLVLAQNAGAGPIDSKLAAALAADSRPNAHTERDANRKPAETLAFFGLEDDMRVVELIPGGGWYTRLLAPVLADNGELFVAIGAGRLEQSLLAEPGFDKVRVLSPEVSFERTEPFGLRGASGPFSLGIENADMILTFRNLHNFNAEARRHMNQAVFDALKPGGIYGVVDHTARHNEPMADHSRRRLDPVVVIDEMLALGFEYGGSTDLHYRSQDDLTKEVGDASVSGQTDRFTLKFRKP